MTAVSRSPVSDVLRQCDLNDLW